MVAMRGSTNALGDFLRARREQTTPGSVGLPSSGRRRVPGLRREEVAMLAGISVEYYLRLEQGRDRNPSTAVLEAIARVLGLDGAEADYLLQLTRPPARQARARRETVPAGVKQLLLTVGLPAFVEGRFFDVLAANDLARALSPRLVVGRNRLRDVFLDPDERALYPNWDRVTERIVAGFRDSAGNDTDNPRMVQLVGELSLASDRFGQLWARHNVRPREGTPETFAHPQVGDLVLYREKLVIGGTDGLMLVLYHARAGTPGADQLVLLGMHAAARPEDPASPVRAADRPWPE